MSDDLKDIKHQALEADKTMKRDHDSMDDFEHLEHDSSPVQESQRQQTDGQRQEQPLKQMVDVPRVGDLIDISKSFDTNFMKASESADDSDLRPVPATPPPSADFEKCEAMAQSSDPFQRPLDQALLSEMVDPKTATMAFMETERTYAPASFPTHQDTGLEVSPAIDSLTKKYEETKPEDSSPVESPLIPTTESSRNIGDSSTCMNKDLQDKLEETKFESKPTPSEDDNLMCMKGMKRSGKEDSLFSSASKNIEDYDSKDIQDDFLGEIKSSVLPAPEKSPTIDFLGDEMYIKGEKNKNIIDDDSWNVVEKPSDTQQKIENIISEPPTKPLPPLPKEADLESDRSSNLDKFEMSNDFIVAETTKGKPLQQSGTETGDSEFESEAEPSPAKSSRPVRQEVNEPKKVYTCRRGRVEDIEIAPKEIFRDMGLDAWFNPERLNPQVVALIYWRDPKKSGIVFGAILGVLLSLAYFSLISVLAYISLLILTGTIAVRIYKTILQAVQKTSDGHPFDAILNLDLTVPAERVHEVADVAVVHLNAAASELRRLFLVEDLVDSIKFGVLLWCLTYVGSWFNGMTLIIIGVVALFTLPKVYETNKAQIDQNVALMQAKVNEITAKVKAAIPLGKKPEPTKEE